MCLNVSLSSLCGDQATEERDEKFEGERSDPMSTWQHQEEAEACTLLLIDRVCGTVPVLVCRTARLVVARKNPRVQPNRHPTPSIECVEVSRVEGIPCSGGRS